MTSQEYGIVNQVLSACLLSGRWLSMDGKNLTNDISKIMKEYAEESESGVAVVEVFTHKGSEVDQAVIQFTPGNGVDVVYNWSVSLEKIVCSVLDVDPAF